MNSIKRLRSIGIIIALMIVVFVTVQPAYSADKKQGKEAKMAARRLEQMKQQMEAEKAQLQTQFQTEKAALEEKAKLTEQQSLSLKSSLAATQRAKQSAAAELEKVRKEKADLANLQATTEKSKQEALAELENEKKKNAKLLSDLQILQRDTDAQRKDLSLRLSDRANTLSACEAKNNQLHETTLALINACENPSAFKKILRSEPITQLKHVELENTLQTIRDKADEQKIDLSAK